MSVGMQGERSAQSRVLAFLGGDPLVEREGGYSSYEGVVTALAFAHSHPKLAFAVRERRSHKLILADPENLNVRGMTVVEEHEHAQSWTCAQ